MADPASRDDVQRAVQDGLRDIRNDLARIRDDVQKIEQRTNDLDDSQREIRQLADTIMQIRPELQNVIRQLAQNGGAGDQLERVVAAANDTMLRTQNVERGVLAITQYLQAKEQAKADSNESNDGFRKL